MTHLNWTDERVQELNEYAASLWHHKQNGICICDHNEYVCGVHTTNNRRTMYRAAFQSLYRMNKTPERVVQLAARWVIDVLEEQLQLKKQAEVI